MKIKTLPWLRLYTDAYRNPKLGRLSDKQHRFWFACLCIAGEYGGFLPSDADMAYLLRVSESSVASRKAELIAAGLLDDLPEGLVPHNWSERQFRSDLSTQRVRRYRNGHETFQQKTDDVSSPFQKRDETLSDTDTDTEEIQIQSAPAGAGVTEISSKPKTKGKKRDPPEWLKTWFADRFWPHRWRNEGKAYALLCLAQKVDTEAQAEAELLSMLAQREQYLRRPTDKRPHMSTWINQDRAKDEPELFDRGMDPGTKQEQANAVFEALIEDRLRGQQIYTRRLE